VIAVDGKPYAGPGTAATMAATCSPPLITLTAWCQASWSRAPRPAKSRCSPPCWTASRSPVRSSAPTRCTPSASTPATWPGAHYVITVKRNQPRQYAQLAALPWRDVPVGCTRRECGHGRTERRTLKVTSVAKGPAFPHTAQAIKVARRRKVNGTWSCETCYAVMSLTVTPASHAQLAAIIRGLRGTEDRLHWVRDLDFDEDRSQARTAAGPRVMASLRNLVITIVRLAGAASIAAALRYLARLPGRPLQTIMRGLNDFGTRGWRVPRCSRLLPPAEGDVSDPAGAGHSLNPGAVFERLQPIPEPLPRGPARWAPRRCARSRSGRRPGIRGWWRLCPAPAPNPSSDTEKLRTRTCDTMTSDTLLRREPDPCRVPAPHSGRSAGPEVIASARPLSAMGCESPARTTMAQPIPPHDHEMPRDFAGAPGCSPSAVAT
jgi:hypothetical protein